MAQILIVDSDPISRATLNTLIKSLGHSVSEAADAKKAVSAACTLAYQLIILCLDLPRDSSTETLRSIVDECPDVPVIVTTEQGTESSALEATKLGAFQCMAKPFNAEEVKLTVERAINRHASTVRSKQLLGELQMCYGFRNLVGVSPAAKSAYATASEASRSNSPVALFGEPGTGKAYLARAIHFESDRAFGPFVKVNCAAADESTLERELFGCERGAFDDAISRRIGLFERANGGTIFLDGTEFIGPNLQKEILTALTGKKMLRVGGSELVDLDVRVIVATSADPEEETDGGQLVGILQRQFGAISVVLPALRDRREDLPALVDHFVRRYAHETGKSVTSISDVAMSQLAMLEWTGNLRELSNCIERGVIACRENSIQPSHLALDGMNQPTLPFRKQKTKIKSLRDVEREHIEKVLIHCEWNRSAAANFLEIDRKTLRSKIREFGFVPPTED